MKRGGSNASLSHQEHDILRAYYYLRTQDSGFQYLEELFARGQIKA
jgi:hypothetical protein